MSETVYNVLFLCTGNSARSIIGESVLNKLGMGRFRGFSAGSHPKGAVNPHVLSLLEATHFPVEDLRSKPWDEFAAPGAPVMDFVFTVCDDAAGEVCPVWPGQPITAHWGLPDPAKATGEDWEIDRAYSEVFRMLRRRIEIMLALPLASLDRMRIERSVRAIGGEEGATDLARRLSGDGAHSTS
jgi:arsenate reductase